MLPPVPTMPPIIAPNSVWRELCKFLGMCPS